MFGEKVSQEAFDRVELPGAGAEPGQHRPRRMEELFEQGAFARTEGRGRGGWGLAGPGEQAQFQGEDPEGIGPVLGEGLEEVAEQLEQPGQGGIRFGRTLDQLNAVGGMAEGGVVVSEQGEGFAQGHFFEGMKGAAAGKHHVELSPVAEIEAATQG